MDINSLIEISNTNRIVDLNRLASDVLIRGDFEGNVTGHWVKLNKFGAGIVTYNNKEYVTQPIGFTSLPPGVAVEMSYANGVYYSKW